MMLPKALRMACCLLLITTGAGVAVAADAPSIADASRRWSLQGTGGTPDFQRHVVPLFSKLGCNMRNCHGSFQGQQGFRLSLFGFEPHLDHRELLETDPLSEGDGPRIDIENPAASLFLIKPTSAEDHSGGQRMTTVSWQYRLLQAWIAAGATFRPKSTTKLRRLEISPTESVVRDRALRTQIRTVAWFEDGSREDVTQLTVFTSNDESIAEVSSSGVVKALRTGDTSIIARYGGMVVSTQVLVPAPKTRPFPTVFPHNRIDEAVLAKLRKLNLPPSDLSTDGDFVRRAYLDVLGKLPTAAETRTLLASRAPDKRAELIEHLLRQPEYAVYWGMKFSDWTGNSKYINNKAMLSNWLWQQWIEDKLSRDVPYDEIVYGFVCATSLEGRPRDAFLSEAKQILHKAAGRYNYDDDLIYARRRTNELYWSNVERRKPETMVLQTANSFLGLRLECARCHNHPFDRWTQRDFEQFKSFFMAVRFCDPSTGKEKRGGGGRGYGVESVEPGVTWRYLQTVKKMPPKLLGASEVPYVDGGKDVRIQLWQWMRAPDNPYFARSFVNRIWHHYFGAGIVHPPDDFNQGNPPSNPQLLDWLAREFIEHQFDIKHIHRLILNSRTYQLSWVPNADNRLDRRNFSHARLRRMPAEVLIDAVADVTGVPNTFGRLPKGRSQRAVGQAMPALRYGAQRGGYAMKIFGRPDREKTCDCERSSEPSVAQALYLINDQDVLSKLESPGGRLSQLLRSKPNDRELINELYVAALSRHATQPELQTHLQHLKSAKDRSSGVKDILWALINVREFVFVH